MTATIDATVDGVAPEPFVAPTGEDAAPTGDDEAAAPAVAPRPAAHPITVTAVAMVCIVAATLLFYIVVLSGIIHQVRQTRQFNSFRVSLAAGTAPIAYADQQGHPLPNGLPVALMEIPAIGVHQVIGEGTTPEVLASGPGLYRAAAFPGQAGNTVVFGRQSAYGGPFGHLPDLKIGQKVKLTTGIGSFTYKVIDLRHPGDPVPPALKAGAARLTLITATGTPFLPSGILRVDADLVGQAQPSTGTSALPISGSERPNGVDTSTLWQLVFWVQGLVLAAIGAVLAWHRWGRAQTWIVFLPVTLLVTYFVSDQVTRLLPNLL